MSNAVTSQRALAAALIALLTALAGLTAAVLGMPPEQLAPRLWRGYYTLLVDSPDAADGPASLAAALLRRPGIDAVVSKHTSPVSFNTFAGFATIPVADLSRRLDPRDPRNDPYLRGLAEYFRGETAKGGALEVLYIRCQRSPAWLLRLLARLPEARHAELRLLGYGGGAWLRLAVFAAFAGLLIARQEGWLLRLLAAGAAVPWVPAVGFGTWLSLLAAMALLPLWAALLGAAHPFLRERLFASARGGRGTRGTRGAGRASGARGTRGLRAPAHDEARGRGRGPGGAPRALGCLAAAAAVLLLLEAAGQSPGPAVLAGGAGLLLLPLLHAALALEYVLYRHAPFLPLPIVASRGSAGRKVAGASPAGGDRARRLTALAMVGLAAVSLPLLAAQSRVNPPRVPAPGRTVEAGLTWTGLRSLERYGTAEGEPAGNGKQTVAGGDLANLADYISHRAFQEGLAFARPYSLPSPEERLVIPAFLEGAPGPELVRADTVALRRDEAWLGRTLAGAPVGSVARLLVDQGRAAPVRLQPARGLGVGPAGAALYGIVVLFLGLLLLPSEYDLTAWPLCVKRGVAFRRRRHAQ